MASIKREEVGRSGSNQPAAAHAKGRLIDVVGLRNLISTLNPSGAQRKAIETDLKGIRQRAEIPAGDDEDAFLEEEEEGEADVSGIVGGDKNE